MSTWFNIVSRTGSNIFDSRFYTIDGDGQILENSDLISGRTPFLLPGSGSIVNTSLPSRGNRIIGVSSGDDGTEPETETTSVENQQVDNVYYGSEQNELTGISAPPDNPDDTITFYFLDGDDQLVENESFNSILYGGDGDDILLGSKTRTYFFGDAGNDTLKINQGRNIFVFEDSWGQDIIIDNPDAVTESTFEFRLYGNNDHMTVDLSLGSAVRGDNTVTFDPSLNLTEVSTGSGNDIIKGNEKNQILRAGNGNDVIYAYDGDDYLSGGGGNDILYGGEGNDTYEVNRWQGNIVIDDIGGDNDSFDEHRVYGHNFSSVDLIEAQDSNGDGFLDQLYFRFPVDENWSSDIATFTIKNYFDNTSASLVDSNAGTGLIENMNFYQSVYHFEDIKNFLLTLNDRPEGLPEDAIVGSNLTDILEGTSDDDEIYGLQGDDEIHSGDGNDFVYGNEGEDKIYGDDGDDILTGGAGDNELFGGSGNDKLYMNESGLAEPADFSEESISEFLNQNGGSMYGDEGNDELYGSNAWFDGGEGNDIYHVGYGYNHLVFGDNWGQDVIVSESSDVLMNSIYFKGYDLGITFDYNINEVVSGGNRVSWSSDFIFTNVSGGNGDDTIYLTGDMEAGGNDGNDTIYGGDGSSWLRGQKGDDTIYGGGGDDRIWGDAGNDYLAGGTGNDEYQWAKEHLIGGGDRDKTNHDVINDESGEGDSLIISGYPASQSSVGSVQECFVEDTDGNGYVDQLKIVFNEDQSIKIKNYFDNTYTYGEGRGLIETIEFNDAEYGFNDIKNILLSTQPEEFEGMSTINGTNNNDTIHGTEQADVINGLGGRDSLYGEGGNDIIYAGNYSGDYDNDEGANMYGDAGDDKLYGDGGYNAFHGGEGNDTYYSGSGYNSYHLLENWGIDHIALNSETSLVHDLNFAALSSNGLNLDFTQEYIEYGDNRLTWDENLQFDSMSITDGNDVIYLGWGTDIWARGGDDIVYGSEENDWIQGLRGFDKIYGNGGDDRMWGNDSDHTFGGAGNDEYSFNVFWTRPKSDTTPGLISDESGDADYIDFWQDYSELPENSWQAVDTDGNGYADQLAISNWVVVENYFDNTESMGAGSGLIETIKFDDGTSFDFDDIKEMANFDSSSPPEEPEDPPVNEVNGDHTNNTLYGHVGQDLIRGKAGDDTMYGGDGDDELHGGLGDDLLLGGNDNDTYHVNLGEGHDTVNDSQGDADSLVLDYYSQDLSAVEFIDTDSNGHGDQLKLHFGNNHSVTVENYLDNTVDQNAGTGHIESVQFIDNTYDLAGMVTLESSTFPAVTIIGTEGDDALYGNALNNRIFGLGGNDTLFGGAGDDDMTGGAGDDTYVFNNENDRANELENGGNDLIYSYGNAVMSDHVERLELLGSGDTYGEGSSTDNYLKGNSGDNVLNGNDGDDVLNGMAGNDTLNGGAGNDYLNGNAGLDAMAGGTGDDTYIVDNEDETVTEDLDAGVDTVKSTDSFTLGDNVENLELLGNLNIDATGNELDNLITGNAGANTLTGNAGNDHISGGFGDDVLIGGVGDDYLNGGVGADSLSGGEGDDVYIIDNVNDTATENAGEGYDTVETIVDWTLGENFEKLYLFGTSGIDGTGNDLNNLIVGNYHSNVLSGEGGDDVINAGNGNDTLYGGAGNDYLNGEVGSDTMMGGEGNDIYVVDRQTDVVMENANEGYDTVYSKARTFTLGDNIERLELKTDFKGKGVGNDLNNVLIGNDQDNILSGKDGSDWINAGNGNNTLEGGNDNDFLISGNGNDGYYFETGFGVDTIADAGGVDHFLFSGYSLNNVTGWMAFDTDFNNNIDQLAIHMDDGNSLFIQNYFDNATNVLDDTGVGSGHIESIIFDDVTISFADIPDFVLV